MTKITHCYYILLFSQTRFRNEFESAQDSCYLVCIPQTASLVGIAISQSFVGKSSTLTSLDSTLYVFQPSSAKGPFLNPGFGSAHCICSGNEVRMNQPSGRPIHFWSSVYFARGSRQSLELEPKPRFEKGPPYVSGMWLCMVNISLGTFVIDTFLEEVKVRTRESSHKYIS